MSETPKRPASSRRSASSKSTPSGGHAGGGASGGDAGGGAGTAVLNGPGFKRQAFIKNYANMVAQTWIDQGYLELVLADPSSALTKAGLPTPDGSTVRVVQMKITGMGQISDQVAAWVAGHRTGLFDLYLPLKPDDFEIGDGGGAPVGGCAGGDGPCCCCSPCCCCT